MKRVVIFSIIILNFFLSSFGQNTIELTFTAENNGQYVPMDEIFIENLTHNSTTTLYYPDNILILEYTGIAEIDNVRGNDFTLSQNYPNPFTGQTEVELYLYEKEYINISVSNLLGQELSHYNKTLAPGNHTFTFYPANEQYYLLTVTGTQTSKTIKMLNECSNTVKGRESKIVYNGNKGDASYFKSHADIDYFYFELGDELQFTCYMGSVHRSINDYPSTDLTYTFYYAGNLCPGISIITDIEGNTYNTVQIGDQCWMRENLKTTTFRNGTPIPNVPGDYAWESLTSAAYVWYNNDISWKDSYGALYNWYAAVDTNGLCPAGWSVPTHDDWTALYDYIGGHGHTRNELKSCRQVNSPLGEGCNTTEHPRWEEASSSYGTDNYAFSGLPGGWRVYDGYFNKIGQEGFWYSSSEDSSTDAWGRYMDLYYGYLGMCSLDKHCGFSIRCIKD